MPEYAHTILKRAREAHVPKMQQWRLGQEVGVSVETIKRWESGDTTPDPDDVDRIGKALNEGSLWHRWMLAQYDSYNDRYSYIPDAGALAATISLAKYEIGDLTPYFTTLERDALDGKIDDADAARRFVKEAKEGIGALQQMLEKVERML